MSKSLKTAMAERLDYLMRVNPSMDTLVKVAAKAGVSYGTVQRIKNCDETDVAITKVEAIANAFGMSLSEFVSEPGTQLGLSAEEIALLQTMRKLSDKDRSEVLFYAQTRELHSSGKMKGLLS